MRFVLTIDNMDNAAFSEDNGEEVSRILRDLAINLSFNLSEGDSGRLMDINGNRVGGWHVDAGEQAMEALDAMRRNSYSVEKGPAKAPIILECGHPPTEPHSDFTTGYGVDKDGNRKCYSCCADTDRQEMIETGKAALYLSKSTAPGMAGVWTVGNWPGSLKFRTTAPRKGRHNIARTRYDVWFTGPDGKDWHGVQYGENTQICHCHRLAKQPTQYEYRLYVNYGRWSAWEHEISEDSISEIRQRAREYRENSPQYPVKWRRVRMDRPVKDAPYSLNQRLSSQE